MKPITKAIVGVTTVAVSVGVLMSVAAADTGTGAARPNVSQTTNMTFSGPLTDPTVTVTGTGFGNVPTNGVPVSKLADCPADVRGTGLAFPGGTLWFMDPSGEWGAGYVAHNVGGCVGIKLISWSDRKVVFKFGSSYGTVHGWILSHGDGAVASVRGYPEGRKVP